MTVDEAFKRRDEAMVTLREAKKALEDAEHLVLRCKETVSLAEFNYNFQDKVVGLAIQAEKGA